MICKPCAQVADWQSEGMPPPLLWGHEECEGCDCAHKPVKEGQISGA